MLPKNIMKTTILAGALLAGTSISAFAQQAPFGGADDTAYAAKLWDALSKVHFVGDDSIKVRPFEGNEPHGAIQEVLASTATIDGHTGRLLLKRNHVSKGDLTVEEVYDNPTKYLASITVMFKREAGYDPQDKDWFWAKYLPDGTLDKNPKGMQMAGRVAKGMDQGCIACHTAIGGEDLETLTSK